MTTSIDAANLLRKNLSAYGENFSIATSYHEDRIDYVGDAEWVIVPAHYSLLCSFDRVINDKPVRVTCSTSRTGLLSTVDAIEQAVKRQLLPIKQGPK